MAAATGDAAAKLWRHLPQVNGDFSLKQPLAGRGCLPADTGCEAPELDILEPVMDNSGTPVSAKLVTFERSRDGVRGDALVERLPPGWSEVRFMPK